MPHKELHNALLKKDFEGFSALLNSLLLPSPGEPPFDINAPIPGCVPEQNLLMAAISSQNPNFCRALIQASANVNVTLNNTSPIKLVLDRIYPDDSSIMPRSFKVGIDPLQIEILVLLINGNKLGGADLKPLYRPFAIDKIRVEYSILAWLAISLPFDVVANKITREDIKQIWIKILNCKLNAHRFNQAGNTNINGYQFCLEHFTPGITTAEL